MKYEYCGISLGDDIKDIISKFNISKIKYEKDLKYLSFKLGKTSQKINLESLTDAEIDITDELNGHNLSIVACGLADKNYCYYRGPHSGGAIFVAFDGVDERVFAPINAKDFADIVVNSIQQFPLNHKLFIESFLDWNKNKYKWQENIIIADFGKDGELEIEFEKVGDNFRIKNINLNSSYNNDTKRKRYKILCTFSFNYLNQ